MRQQLSESEGNEPSTKVTIEFQQPRDTVDLIQLRAMHQLSFDDVQEAVRRKDEALKRYAAKSNANEAWLDSENELLDAITGYVNIAGELIDELDLRKKQSDDLTIEAYSILSQATELTSHATW